MYLRCAGDAFLKAKGALGNLYRISSPYRNGDDQYVSNEVLEGRYSKLFFAPPEGNAKEFQESGGKMVRIANGALPAIHKFRMVPPAARWEVIIPRSEVYKSDGTLRDKDWALTLKFVCVSL